MARTTEKIQQSDVSFWGILAVCLAGVAFGTVNLSALLPDAWLSGLHGTRLGGGSLTELQKQVASLQEETTRLRAESGKISTMLTLADRNRQSVTQRVGALEKSIPVLLEQIPLGPQIDSTTITSSVENEGVDIREIDGGRVAVSVQPLNGTIIFADEMNEIPGVLNETPGMKVSAMPEQLDLEHVSSNKFGLAMGERVSVQDAFVYWTDIRNNVGALLLDLEPLLARSGDQSFHLVAGPVDGVSEAQALCAHVLRAGLECLPVPYSGYELPK